MTWTSTDSTTEDRPAEEPGTGMFRALRVRNYRRYASANLVSLTGTWMQRIGQDWLVLQLTDDSGVAELFERQADLAVKGDYWETGRVMAQRRRRDVPMNMEVRDVLNEPD